MRLEYILRTIALISLVIMLQAPVFSGGFISKKTEISLGNNAAAEFEAEHPPLDNPELQAMVGEIAQSLLPHTETTGYQYQVKIVEWDIINAMALPGGHVYLTSGLMDFVETEEELAGVIEHEIGHVDRRHGKKIVERDMVGTLGLSILIDAADLSNDQALVGFFGKQIWVSGYGRDNEYEADRMGVYYTMKSGYDPRRGLKRFMQRLDEMGGDEPSGIDAWFASHPKSEKRANRIEELIVEFEQEGLRYPK